MRLKRLVLIGLVVFSTSGHSLENFGDEVIKCLAEKHAQPTDENFHTLSTECEKKIQDKRTKEDDSAKIKLMVKEVVKARFDEYENQQRVLNLTANNYYCYSDELEKTLKHIDFKSYKDCSEAENSIWEDIFKTCFFSYQLSANKNYILKYFKGNESAANAYDLGLSWSNHAMVGAVVYKACDKNRR